MASFLVNRSINVLGAVTTQYIVEHPQIIDSNTINPLTQGLRNSAMEVVNATSNMIYIAFDRAVVPPSGNGVQGVISPAVYTKSGPFAATQGDFDVAIFGSGGWPAADIAIPYNSKYMSVYCVAAGNVVINYGSP